MYIAIEGISYDHHKIKVVTNINNLMLVYSAIDSTIDSATERYFASIKSIENHLEITQEAFQDIVKILNKMNCDEALLSNEQAIEKAKKAKKEKKEKKKLEDIKQWNKQEVHALLGIKIDE